ncbi:MAG: protein kinase [Pseudomonadota bacterium]|nr:protein kinase [Pseudomonadota bacterium]
MEGERRELEFLRTLGTGGFGAVYLANLHGRDRFVRRVAVKVMREGLDATPDLVARQKDEARLLGLLAHDGIVQVLDLAEVEGRPAVVMEYVEGVDLADLIKNIHPRRVPVRAALELISGTAAALDAAYNSSSALTGQPLRVIHRDIKPANVLLTVHGRVKVLDFGVAKADFARDGHTTNGGWGTPRFMAPEQWLGEAYGSPVDIYALGVTLYDLVANGPWERPPLARTPFEHKVGQLLNSQTDLPEVVLELIAAMTSFEPADRPSAADVRERCDLAVSVVGGESLSRFARDEVPALVEARSRSNANKPLPNTVTLGGVSTGNGSRANGGGRAEPTHEPSIAALPPRAPEGFRPAYAIAAVVLAAVGIGVVGVGVVGWQLSRRWTGDAPPAEAVTVSAVAPVPSPEPPVIAPPSVVEPVDPGPVEPAPADEVKPDPHPEVFPDEPPKKNPPKPPSGIKQPVVAQTAGAAAERPVAATFPLDITADTIGMSVWVDGTSVGTTPLTDHPLTAGPHTFAIAVGGERSAPYTLVIGSDGPAGLRYYSSQAKWRTSR